MKICLTMKIYFQHITDSIDNSQNRDQSTSIQNDDCHHNNSKHPKVKDFLEHFRI